MTTDLEYRRKETDRQRPMDKRKHRQADSPKDLPINRHTDRDK